MGSPLAAVGVIRSVDECGCTGAALERLDYDNVAGLRDAPELLRFRQPPPLGGECVSSGSIPVSRTTITAVQSIYLASLYN